MAEYVFKNVGEVLAYVRANLNLPGIDLNVYKPGGCLFRAFGAAKENVGRKLTLDSKNTGPKKTVELIDHFVQWPGELGEDVSSILANSSVKNFFKEEAYDGNIQTIKKLETQCEGSSNTYFVKILEGFKFKWKKLYKASERELTKGVLVLYIDVEPLDVCPYNIIHRLLENSHHLFLSKDPKAGVPIYDSVEESLKARVGSPERLRELLGTLELSDGSYHTLNAQSYSLVSSDKAFSVEFKKEKQITACQSELIKFTKNSIEVNIYPNLTINNTTIHNYLIQRNTTPIAGLEDFWNTNSYEGLVYDHGYCLQSKLQADLDIETSFVRVFMESPTPVLFARFLTIVFGGRGIVYGDSLYLANGYNVYEEYNKEATLGMLAYFGEQLLRDGLYNKYLAMRFNLQSPGFLKSCISVLFPFLRDEAKGLGFNTNFAILRLKDGAFDAELNKVRKLELSDYISITLPFSEKDLVYSDNTVIAMNFLENLFKNQEEVYYVLNELRIILFNKMNDKIYFLIGDGANGKTTFINILRLALKNLVGDLLVEAIANIRAFGLNPFIVNLRHCRIGITLQVDIIKRLAGCETITVRSLYANPVTFPFNTRLMLVANNLPKFLATVDYALERRMRYIYFSKNFSNPANILNPLDLNSNKVVNCISLGLLQLILNSRINEQITMPKTFVRYSAYALGELRFYL
ncbi:hypothetical protein CWI39_1652p0010 [Hamiltosporidium magnivora]|uniref:SF3 helicase domain-containing protein n=1 Tax=Hamiltosporidium magnivora TaxID=148818 RepID=A0A4Q9KZQ9_9MICR|nr:hypothetical protein CWI39_1652p0010 [Hamiltosporidium magnivora]